MKSLSSLEQCIQYLRSMLEGYTCKERSSTFKYARANAYTSFPHAYGLGILKYTRLNVHNIFEQSTVVFTSNLSKYLSHVFLFRLILFAPCNTLYSNYNENINLRNYIYSCPVLHLCVILQLDWSMHATCDNVRTFIVYSNIVNTHCWYIVFDLTNFERYLNSTG